LGVLVGYLGYSLTHHATHHWPARNAWTRRRKRWHAMHHGALAQPGYYGVTSGFWDALFGTRPARAPADERTSSVRVD
jgi:cyclopropane-fatty-acyl-phospholipid synthase